MAQGFVPGENQTGKSKHMSIQQKATAITDAKICKKSNVDGCIWVEVVSRRDFGFLGQQENQFRYSIKV